ncbi:TadE/TadG family type IV pilus assembly protein [Sphaerimonospora cavernae]|uniref:TadE/TadG family type IV pilus assembly protein n=1 Tax=Sphaerimonospora cavernae TaxID=1740611 RepID=A0ABV6U1M1_9ACTN
MTTPAATAVEARRPASFGPRFRDGRPPDTDHLRGLAHTGGSIDQDGSARRRPGRIDRRTVSADRGRARPCGSRTSGEQLWEKGAATLEMVVLFPVLLLVLAIAVQAVFVYQARSTAQAAAQEGVRAARAHGAARSAGGAAALRCATRVGGAFLLQPSARVGGDARTVEVVVSGRVPTFLPGADWTVSEAARAPVERFIPASRP